mmetsp:Transcript_16893/g.16921  ORF Transcript_16893/g.16921 Transcript_16893/m.16921 type:complete len:80 (+) Transcript_16893:2596-2835(+)
MEIISTTTQLLAVVSSTQYCISSLYDTGILRPRISFSIQLKFHDELMDTIVLRHTARGREDTMGLQTIAQLHIDQMIIS